MKGIRSTEVRNFIRARGEDGVVECMEQLFERQAAVEQNVQELGLQMLHMSRILEQITTGAGAMREQIEKMQGIGDDDDDLPMAT